MATEDALIQEGPARASRFGAWLRDVVGRRPLGFVLAVAIEGLLILLLLTLGGAEPPKEKEQRPTVITFVAPEASEEPPEQQRQEPERRAEQRPQTPQTPEPQPEQPRPPQPAQPVAPSPAPTPSTIIPMRWSLAPPNPMRPLDRPAEPARPVYGPQDTRSAAMRDTPRVGTAPNGEPLYAAEWYREPADEMMRAYLSGARGPGWGLIACRTAPDFRVEDCVALDEYPTGSNINRAVLAMAWEFRVRPPRRGGQPLVGSWVRIRIDYR